MRLLFVLFLFVFSFSGAAIEDVIALSAGFQNDYTLAESFRGKKLLFKGTYSRVTDLSYDKEKNSIRFSPRKQGVGTLVIKEGKIILKKYTIDVRKTDLNRVAHEIKSLLNEIDGITIKIINNKVTVDGEIFVPRDMKRIYAVIREYKGQAVSLVTLSTSAQNQVARFIEKEIANPNVTVKAANGKFILRGTVASEEEYRNANVIAQLYAPSVVTETAVKEGVVRERDVNKVIINLIKIKKQPKEDKQQKKLVQMIVHYVELEKNYNDLFRFQFAPRIEDNTKFTFSNNSRAGTTSAIAGTINNFFPKLNWAKNFGFARVLHSSNLIVEEGKEGKVSANKKVPYRTLAGQNGGSAVQFADVGITIAVTPYIVGSRKDGVRLKGTFTVNNFLGYDQGSPITSNRTINTSLYVRSGLSAAIGGIVSNNTNRGYNQEPEGQGGKGDPIFNLLSSKGYNKSQNQFVVFITPVIKSSASTGVEQIKKKFRVAR